MAEQEIGKEKPRVTSTETFPINSLDVPRFVGIPTFMRLPQRAEAEGTDVSVIGMPSDNGSPFRTGARFGPNAIRSMSAMLRPISPYRDGIDVFRTLQCADLGDAPVVPGYMPATLEAIQLFFDRVVATGAVTIGLGGDHGCSIAELRSVAKRHGPVSVLHFDSHSDTWDKYFAGERHSAGTPFRRGVEEGLINPEQSIQIGLRGSLFVPSDVTQSIDLGYDVVTWDEWSAMGSHSLINRIVKRLSNSPVFISFDLDVVDPAFAPGVQTPEAGGPSASEVLMLLRRLPALPIVGADIVEVNPLYDGPGQITALLAATVALEIIANIAAGRRERSIGQPSD
ncbi:MAG: agmatinase [Hyphomicrobiales bacterium]|nr:agmatinase [Hyphomicrobiales bacterium]